MKHVNLNTSDLLSLDEVSEAITSWKLNNYKFKGTNAKFDGKIKSKSGYLVLYGCEGQLYIDFDNLKLSFGWSGYTTEGDYVIFDYYHSAIEFDVKKVTKSCRDYESLNLDSTDKPSIILHRKYIHRLKIWNRIERNIEFTPTQRLDFRLFSYEIEQLDNFIKYLKWSRKE